MLAVAVVMSVVVVALLTSVFVEAAAAASTAPLLLLLLLAAFCLGHTLQEPEQVRQRGRFEMSARSVLTRGFACLRC